MHFSKISLIKITILQKVLSTLFLEERKRNITLTKTTHLFPVHSLSSILNEGIFENKFLTNFDPFLVTSFWVDLNLNYGTRSSTIGQNMSLSYLVIC